MKKKIISYIIAFSFAINMPATIVTVQANQVDSEKIDLEESNINVKAGQSVKLKVKFTPDNATNKAVVWSSSNPAVATVNNSGSVKGISSGKATITVKTKDGKKETSCTVEVDFISVKEVKINEDGKNISLDIGKTKSLKATVLPADASNKKIIWESSDTSIATVSTSGSVKALKQGKVTITATSEDGKIKDTSLITIGYIPVEKIEFNEDMRDVSVDVGKSITLKTKIYPEDASIKTISWESSDTSIATVSKSGGVKGAKNGTVTITAKTIDGNKIATSRVTVGNTFVSDIEIINMPTSNTVLAGQEGYILKTQITPENATNKKLIWTSSDTSIAFVSSSGKVIGLKDGNVKITATSLDGKASKTIDLKIVFIKTQGITIDYEGSTVTLGVNNELKVNGFVVPDNASNKYGVWHSTEPTIASIKIGNNPKSPVVIKGLKPGTTIIKSVSLDGGFEKSFKLNIVYIEPENILFEHENANLVLESEKPIVLKAKVIPDESSEKNIIWKSSDENIAKVSKVGSVKGVSPGTVTITATTESGKITKSCTIEVKYIGVDNIKIQKNI